MVSTTTTTTVESKYQRNEHYTEISNPLKQAPPVIVFFSFLDSTSYTWANKDQVAMTIRRHVPSGTTIDRYHAPIAYSTTEFAQELTTAWALAKYLQIDDRIIGPLFEAIHDKKTAIDMQGVKLIFDQHGIPPLRFDREYAKITVQKEAKWMQEVQRELNLEKVPAILVDGKYLLKLDAFGSDIDADRVADVVKELLNLK